ncbi:glycosyltransferase family 4 protein [Patescibacteria group bacterium]|nr:glycosyltransferase family 4 protein [Patescibacteria group bacterium]
MKIAILTPTFYQYSGIDRVVAKQAGDLKRAGHEVIVVTFRAETATRSMGIEVIEISMPKSSFWERVYRLLFFLDFWKISKTATRLKDSDQMICHFYPMSVIACKAKKNNPQLEYIYYDHGVPPTEVFSSTVEKVYIALFKKLSHHYLKSADKIYSVSKYLSQVLKKETGLSSQVQHNVYVLPEETEEVVDVRQKFKLGDSPVILFVGRISPHKAVHELIASFNLLKKKLPSAKLVLVGKKTFDKYGEELSTLSGEGVIFTGKISDQELQSFYKACDVYATASHWEGFDLPIIEAQREDRPVVCYNIGPHLEVVINKELMVKKGDTKEFAQKLRQALKR